MIKRFLTLLLIISSPAGKHSFAQFSENFTDGNFTANPAWVGNTDEWIVNAEMQLQSNNTTSNSTFYLSTPNTKATIAQWDFWVRLAFNPSGANYAEVYLTASAANITIAGTSGYFVRIGDTQDDISLYRKDANGTSVKLIDGADGLLNTSNNVVRIRVTRNAANQWTLLRDITGSGNAFAPEGTATDATYNTSAFFGILVRQSTATFFQRHYFDDIEVKDFIPDNTPPAIVSATASAANTLEVLFNEGLNTATAANPANYSVSNGVGNPSSAVVDALNPLLVRLQFANPFPNGTTLTLTVNGVQDIAGNALTNGTAPFVWYIPKRFDVVINELMIDPVPQIGLPNTNWVELKNTSAFPINIGGYRLGRTTGLSGPLPSLMLQPDSMIVVTTAAQVPALSAFGRSTSVTSFPTLPNGGDLLWLQDASGAVMHAVDYNISWYQNTVKADGGWTLEMIDSRNPCTGAANWRASTDPLGGTPARRNSIAAANADTEPPALLRAFASTSTSVLLTFSEPLDSLRITPANISISNGIGTPVLALAQAPRFNTVLVTLANALQAGVLYTITVSNATDCAGNAVGAANTARVALAAPALPNDIVINEILFHPPPLGFDYLELYNRSNKAIDAATLLFTNRSTTTGNPGTLIPVSSTNRLIFPGEFYVLTENPSVVAQQYDVKFPEVLVASGMPSYPNDRGTAIVYNNTGDIIDELTYDSRWHFALVDNRQGISLERIDYDRPTQNAENWTSAAATARFGTPGYVNSQFRAAEAPPQGSIRLNPVMFSPDGDGFEDFTLIEFEFGEPGFVANVTIMDGAGRPVRVLQRNTTIAARGNFRWDGLNDKQQRVPVGNYVVYFEIFNLRGQKSAFKKGVTVARKF